MNSFFNVFSFFSTQYECIDRSIFDHSSKRCSSWKIVENIHKNKLRCYRSPFLHLRAPAVCAFVFLSCLSFSNLPAIRNSTSQKQTLSSATWVLSRTPSASTTLSRWFVLLRTCNESTYTFPLFRRNPSCIHLSSVALETMLLRARAARSIDIKWSMRHSLEIYVKNMFLSISTWLSAKLAGVTKRLEILNKRVQYNVYDNVSEQNFVIFIARPLCPEFVVLTYCNVQSKFRLKIIDLQIHSVSCIDTWKISKLAFRYLRATQTRRNKSNSCNAIYWNGKNEARGKEVCRKIHSPSTRLYDLAVPCRPINSICLLRYPLRTISYQYMKNTPLSICLKHLFLYIHCFRCSGISICIRTHHFIFFSEVLFYIQK